MSWWLLHNTLTAGLLAAVVVLICRWRVAQPALRHALWLVVLLKLIAPPLPMWSFAWPGALSDWWRETLVVKQVETPPAIGVAEPEPSAPRMTRTPLPVSAFPGDPESYEVLDGPALAPPVTQPVAPRVSQAAISPGVKPVAASPAVVWLKSLTWREVEGIAVIAWCVGVIAMAGYQLYRWRRFQQLLDATRFAPDWLEEEVRGIAAELGIAAPKVQVMDARCTPLVWVLGPARLLWPEAMLEDFSRESRRTIIAHELAHLARRDHWVARVEAVATVFWWWHPLFWYARAKLHDAAEQACDARVTQLLPGARKAYAQALIEVCELLTQAVTPGPALGVGSQTRRAFERRLTMIMREQVSSRLSLGAVLGVGVLALAVLPGFTPAQNTPPSPSLPIVGAPMAPTADPNALPPPSLPSDGAPPAPANDPNALPPPVEPPVAGGFAPPPAVAPSASNHDPFGNPAPVVGPPAANPFDDGSAGGLGAPMLPPATQPGFDGPGIGGMPGGYANPGMAAPMTMPGGGPTVLSGMTPGMPSMEGGMMNPGMAPVDPNGAEEVVHLTRATYRLPGLLAVKLSTLLNETMGDSVQAQVQPGSIDPFGPPIAEGDPRGMSKIVVTADEETQRIVGHFIGLLRARGKYVGQPGATMVRPSLRSAPVEMRGQLFEDVHPPMDEENQTSDLQVEITGPRSANVGEEASFRIRVTNSSDRDLNDVTVLNQFDPQLTPTQVSGRVDGHRRNGDSIEWVPIATLSAGKSKSFTVNYRADEPISEAKTGVTVTCREQVRVDDHATIAVSYLEAEEVSEQKPPLKPALDEVFEVSGPR
jgi:uncharacterized repeat protein (TIGR01451 family)